MKKTITIFTIFQFIALFTFAQDTLVQWTFPGNDSLADGGIAANLTKTITTTAASAIDFKNGLTTKSAQAVGWDNGKDAKYWIVEFSTQGYSNISLSSIITAGGANPGPRDWKVQYNTAGSWLDVSNSVFTVANDWTTGALTNLSLPSACDDQASVSIRWIMASDTAIDGSIVASIGVSKIDDIYVKAASSASINDMSFMGNGGHSKHFISLQLNINIPLNGWVGNPPFKIRKWFKRIQFWR